MGIVTLCWLIKIMRSFFIEISFEFKVIVIMQMNSQTANSGKAGATHCGLVKDNLTDVTCRFD